MPDPANPVPPAETPTTARQLVDMLRSHYLPPHRQPAGGFIPEIQSPDGRRRADALWLPTAAAGGKVLIGHEIKVSRSDVLAELDDPTKSDPWQRYCDRWWLVVADPALVDGLDIPATWGIMAPPSGRRTRSMTVVRPAPRLDPLDQAPAYRRIAAWYSWAHREQVHRAAAAERQIEGLYRDLQLARATPEEPDRPAEPARLPTHQEQLVEKIVVALAGWTDPGQDLVGTWDRHVHVDDVVAALKDLGSVYKQAQQVRNAGVYVARQVAEVRRVLANSVPERDLDAAVQRLEGLQPRERRARERRAAS